MTEHQAVAWLRAERAALVRAIAISWRGASIEEVLEFLSDTERSAATQERQESVRLWGRIQMLAPAERAGACEPVAL